MSLWQLQNARQMLCIISTNDLFGTVFKCYLKFPLISIANYWHVSTHRFVFSESSLEDSRGIEYGLSPLHEHSPRVQVQTLTELPFMSSHTPSMLQNTNEDYCPMSSLGQTSYAQENCCREKVLCTSQRHWDLHQICTALPVKHPRDDFIYWLSLWILCGLQITDLTHKFST